MIGFHDVWHGIPLLLTLCGVGWTLKGFIYFVFPRYGLRVLKRVSLDRSWEFAVAGAVLLALSGLLSISVIANSAGR